MIDGHIIEQFPALSSAPQPGSQRNHYAIDIRSPGEGPTANEGSGRLAEEMTRHDDALQKDDPGRSSLEIFLLRLGL